MVLSYVDLDSESTVDLDTKHMRVRDVHFSRICRPRKVKEDLKLSRRHDGVAQWTGSRT